ncbi:uncharacterized protein J3D65DRAFT_617570 [Phyllosticta citribraziliensis]|uniref:Uncharacterized protein n=1 Tax=Phyllosticta citribraziliensis TaxID=989973 RepID=A0ABR1M4T1_9PEZI
MLPLYRVLFLVLSLLFSLLSVPHQNTSVPCRIAHSCLSAAASPNLRRLSCCTAATAPTPPAPMPPVVVVLPPWPSNDATPLRPTARAPARLAAPTPHRRMPAAAPAAAILRVGLDDVAAVPVELSEGWTKGEACALVVKCRVAVAEEVVGCIRCEVVVLSLGRVDVVGGRVTAWALVGDNGVVGTEGDKTYEACLLVLWGLCGVVWFVGDIRSDQIRCCDCGRGDMLLVVSLNVDW